MTTAEFNSLPPNELYELHKYISDLPIVFRESVCKECNWSIPSFYRRLRSQNKQSPVGPKVVLVLSNAEREKVVSIVADINKGLETLVSKYRK